MTAFTVSQADLEFILRQIKVAEANSTAHSGTNAVLLTEVWVDVDGNVVPPNTPGAQLAIPDPHVPVGLRTVDGSYNNLIPGRELWGAADQQMPRLLNGSYRDDADSDTFDNNGPAPGGQQTNTNYGNPGNVVDADPRIISNLIVDMSVNNPAAIQAWFNNELSVAAWEEAHPGKTPVAPGQPLGDDGVYLTNADLAHIPNIATDEGLTASFNAWMTFFGQFFDHGLDLISKGGNGTVYIPLQADDPLVTVGPDGVAGTGDEVPASQQFMVLTRSTDLNGAGPGNEARNTTTPFVDQNQTYTSHASHQAFLREYKTDPVTGKTVATGLLLNGANDGLPTWADIKAQALTYLGIQLDDRDVLNIPLLRTDLYGELIPDPTTGFAQVIVGIGNDGIPNTADDLVISGTPGNPVHTFNPGVALDGGGGPHAYAGAVRIGHAFLDDIADSAAPVIIGGNLVADLDSDTGNAIARNLQTGQKLEYDNELLDKHFITGDGRGNENIGLTTVHHIFHSEHNRQVEAQKLTVLQSGNLNFINEWLATDLTNLSGLPTTLSGLQAFAATLNWDGERLFQAARFATEMQYQHLVFEEFARKIQPNIDPFVFNNITDINPAIFAEFAHTVYRFGHSMLTDNLPRLDESGDAFDTTIDLVKAFTNPLSFDHDGAMTADEAAASIIRGMTIETGNEIDEFIVSSLRNNLLGLPLDLAALNIARGREAGVPTLNEARQQLYGASGSSFLKPYDNWIEFASNLKNSASVINFIAAYGMHSSITGAVTLEQKRDAATLLVMGNVDVTGDGIPETAPGDRIAYLTGTGFWATHETGLNLIDLWIGGLAEQVMPFGGMLGSTFNAVFEAQLENLQDGDRLYYLSRNQGQNLLVSLEQNSFAKLIMANTNLALPGPDGIRGTSDDVVPRHIGVDAFAKYDLVLEVDANNQVDYNGAAPGVDPAGDDPILEALGLGKVVRNDLGTVGPDANYLRFTGGEHVVAGGTSGNDTIITDEGDDGIWGDAGDDRIESGAGVDLVNGGAGNDIITDSGDTGDFLKGDEGDDVIANSNGLDILMGGTGQDVIFVGVDDTEVFAGQGDDFIAGGEGVDVLMGNEGNDWIEGAGGFDTIAGDNSELFFNSRILGHDVMFAGNEEQDFDAESGDDIMVQGESVIRNEGMFGFDWAIFKGVQIDGNADLRTPIFTTEQQDILRNRFDKVEALSGWNGDDTLFGDDRVPGVVLPGDVIATTEGIFFNDGLSQAGINRIDGLRALLGNLVVAAPATGDLEAMTAFDAGNILLGGAGSDALRGNGGDDLLDGDAWLNVRIRITGAGQANTAANQIATVDSLRHVFTAAENPAWAGKSLFELMISRTIVPNQLHIVREIITDGASASDIDTAYFNDTLVDANGNANYTFAAGEDSITVSHVNVSNAIDPLTGGNLVSDGVDTLRHMERLQFGDVNLTVISGTPDNDNGQTGTGTNGLANRPALNGGGGAELIVGFGGNDVLNGNGGNDILLGGSGTDTLNGGEGNDILNGGAGTNTVGIIDNFVNNAYNNNNGSQNFTGNWTETGGETTGATNGDIQVGGGRLQFLAGIDGGEIVQRSFNIAGATSATLSFNYEADDLDTGESVAVEAFNGATWDTLGTLGGDTNATVSFSAPLTAAHTAVRFRAIGDFEAGENFFIDNVIIKATIAGLNTGTDQLNGGNGNDTYIVNLGNGNAAIQETSGTDRIIVSGAAALTGLNAFVGASDDLVLQINGQQLTVTDHFATAGEVVESINLDGATYEGYVFAGDYVLSTDDTDDRTAAVGVNTLLAGSTGGNTLIGDTGTDLLFGHDGNDELTGGAGDDLLVGGTGSDDLDGGVGADTMVGGVGNDTYIVDDVGDVVVEASGADVDEVQTDLAAYTIGDNVENLTYTGAGTFAGTGNALANRIVGGAGADTLTGLGGNDTYVVTAGDVIVEAAGGGIDTVETATTFTLGVELENLTLTGNAAINGTGNSVANVITGNAGNNQLFGGGGSDNINGGDGSDLIDGGIGDDTLSGGTGTDTDTIIGGDGNDTIDVGNGNDIIRYAAAGFGNDVINNFDSVGGSIANQDLIDLSALGITAANFATRVTIQDVEDGTLDDTLITVRDADGNTIGTIKLEEVEATGANGVTAADFILSAPAPAPFGSPTNAANTITGNNAANLINGLGGNDVLSGAGGDDVINGGEGADTLNGGDNNDTLSGGAGSDTGNFVDNFGANAYTNNNGTLNFTTNWTETNDGAGTGSPTGGDILINGGRLQFVAGTDGGEVVQRSFNIAGATSASLSFNYEADDLDAGESVTVEAFNGSTWQLLGTLGGDVNPTLPFTAPLTAAHTAIRFTAVGSFEAGENFFIDNVIITATIPGLNAGADTINGDAGDDTVIWNANESGPTDGRDIVNGGTETATGAGDTFVINGNASTEMYRIYTLAAWDAVAGNDLASFGGRTPEIVITRNGTAFADVIAELSEIEEIRINGFDPAGNGAVGNDAIEIFGDFSATSLRPNTITVNGGTGNDTVDISDLLSAHRILFRSFGGNDTIIGELRPQDVIELAPGTDLSAYTLTDNGNGTKTLSNGTNSITFTGAVPPLFQEDSTPPDDVIDGVFEYTPSDLAGLKALVNGLQPPNAGDDDVPLGVRELSGHGNNIDNPTWGNADQPFIRITNSHYGEPDAFGNRAINPVFDGLDPRNISNILGQQEANLPKAGNDANIFFMAMGQYIDHGLDFLGKGGNGSIQIGAPGGGGPTGGNPADLTRGTVDSYEDGVPQHLNRTSPYVDQNQAYGSNTLVGQFLREGDGQGGLGAHLFAGGPDPSNPAMKLLPTLRELILEHWENNTVFHSPTLLDGQVAFRDYFAGLVTDGVINPAMLPAMISSFMGTNHALLLDTNPFINVLDHYVAGDGRANENFALTSIHTIWARNHNHHVEGLEAAGFQGTAEELFQAAKMINEAEYQRVVFDEYLGTLLGGLRSEGTHGFDEYNPNVNSGISHEFAAAVFRFGHSLIGQTMTVLDANGNPTQVTLFDAFLNPSNDAGVFTLPLDQLAQFGYVPQPGYGQHGVDAIIGGIVTQPAEDVDFNIVDAVRNDLVRISADLFSFNVARGWDLGIGTLNQIRKDLAASADPYVSEAVGFAGGDLSAYTSWEDFQQRNELSDAVIDQFRQAYPDLELAAADIAAFQAINPDIDVALQQDGTGIVKGIDRLDLWVGGLAEKHINDGVVGQTFWVVLSEQFERLQDGDRFYYISRFDNFDFYENFIDGQEFADIVARNTGITNLPEHMFETEVIHDEDQNDNDDDEDNDDDNDDDENNNDDDDNDDEDNDDGNNDDDEDNDDEDDNDNDDDDDDEDDDTTGNDDDDDEDDDTTGNDDDDDEVTPVPPAGGVIRTGTPLADVLAGGAGDDNIVAFAGDDVAIGEAGDDAISTAEGNDFIRGGDGRDVIFAGSGDDQVFAGSQADIVFGDAGADRIFGDAGNDLINAGAGNDTVFGGAGNDLIVAEVGDGDDAYFGDDSEGGAGIDTLDMSAITANAIVNLGSGPVANGSAFSSQTGNDTLWGIENVTTGSGNDTITASNAINVMNGGAGADTFKFVSASGADGDTIIGFEPGDRLDLSGIDADLSTAGDQAFTLVTGAAFTVPGQLAVSFGSGDNGDFTLVQGSIDGNAGADFTIQIEGHHTLTNANLTS